MFNNIIYFIVVLLIFSISFPDNAPENSLLITLEVILFSWLLFSLCCYWGFQRILMRISDSEGTEGLLAGQYQGLILKLSILGIFMFSMVVMIFNFKYWLQMIPGFQHLSVFQGVVGLSLFFFYLCTIWYCAHPAYKKIFRIDISRRSFIQSNLRLNFPILFPWMALTFAYDLVGFIPWVNIKSFMDRVEGQMLFYGIFLTILMVFMPLFIQHWWRCDPLGESEKERELLNFLREKKFKYRGLLKWSLFEGRMLTAGIMGIIPRFRYILVTDSLLDALTLEELKAVLVHEMGHAKYRHLLFYVFFFVGYLFIFFGLFDFFSYFLAAQPFFLGTLTGTDAESGEIFYLTLAFPMLISLFIYFRYVMGFFMRNFERQADLYSAVVMGSPEPVIRALEKIAFLSGKIRDLPSWHHFSIRERVDCLFKTLQEPNLTKRHNRFVFFSFLTYLAVIISLGYLLNFSFLKKRMANSLADKILTEQILQNPKNVSLYKNLAVLYHQMEQYDKAIEVYGKIIDLDPGHAFSLNNLAWLLVTSPQEELRDERRALELAKRAVGIENSPIYLDTLAEAYYANGLIEEALMTIKEAISLVEGGRGYYEGQLQKFKTRSEGY